MARVESSSGQFQPNAVKKAKILGIELPEGKFKDVYIKITIQREDSQYDSTVYIVGDFERNTSDNSVKANWLINKVNDFLDVIGYSGGYNIRGQFESIDGTVLPALSDIQQELNKFIEDTSARDIVAYFYQEWDEVEGKAWSRVFLPLFRSGEEAKCQNKIAKLIEKGKLKPYVPADSEPTGGGFTKDLPARPEGGYKL